MSIGAMVWNGLAVVGLIFVGCAVVVLVLLVLEEQEAKRAQEAELCCCIEVLGDNPDCPLHRELWAQYDRILSKPTQETHFERELKEQVRNWPVSGPCGEDDTAQTRKYLRRGSKGN